MVRTCIACRKTSEFGKDHTSQPLLRVVLVNGKVIPDSKAIAVGRGAWIHPQCGQAAIDREAFRWAFKLVDTPDTSELSQFLYEMDAKDMKLK